MEVTVRFSDVPERTIEEDAVKMKCKNCGPEMK